MNDSLMNTTVNTTTSPDEMSLGSRHIAGIVTFGFIHILVILVAFFGNAAVILAIFNLRRPFREKSNYFLINLAISDMTTAVVVMVSVFVALVQDKWTMGEIWCDMVCAFNYCFIIVSMLTLCFISLDRYQAIIHPFTYKVRVTKRGIMIAIAYSWLQGIAFALVPAIQGWVAYDYWEVVCAIQWAYEGAVHYVVCAFVLCFMLPGLIMTFCYARILKAAKGMTIKSSTADEIEQKRRGTQPNIEDTRPKGVAFRTEEINRKINRTIRSLLIVLVCFFVFMTPFCVTKLIKVIYPSRNIVPGYVNLASSGIGYLSNAINPLIYGIFRRDFRIAFLIATHRIFYPNTPLADRFTQDDLETLTHSVVSRA